MRNRIFKIKDILVENQKKIFLVFAIFTVFTVSVYLFSVNSIVFNTVKKAQIEKEINILTHKISELEFGLINKKNAINIDMAYSMGFQDVQEVKFLQKRSVAVAQNSSNIQ